MSLPNQLSLLRILLTPVFAYLLFLDSLTAQLASFIVFTVASLTDWYDGYFARKFGIISTWGKFLDPLADKILISSCFICFSVKGYIPFWMVIIILIRALLITILRSYGVLKRKPMKTNFLAKVKTFGQFTILYIIFIYHLFIWGKSEDKMFTFFKYIKEANIILILMYIITILTAVSGIIYFFENRSSIRQMVRDVCRLFIPSNT
jgi:CDP-diacylglycerol--glycerol-3-phosphate 3-phosphatidyltransferase